MPSWAGKKISGQHSSLIDVAEKIVKTADSLDCVSKIVLGVIKQVNGPAVGKSLKISPVAAGLKIKVRGPKTVQELFVYTNNRELTETAITNEFNT